MEELNYRFYELFSKVDKLCIDVYQNEHGLADYVEDMRSFGVASVEHIPDWEEDLLNLINLRNVRNSLVASPGAFKEEVCTWEQVEWLEHFHQRILDRQDPLARLEEFGYQPSEGSHSRLSEDYEPEIKEGSSKAHERYVNGILVAGLVLAIVLVTCIAVIMIYRPSF